MIINAENLRTVGVAFNGAFNVGFGAAPTSWRDIAMETKSSTLLEEYGWLGLFPAMREWLGDRVVQSLSVHSYSIRNRDFELTISVPRNHIEDDNFGIYGPMFQEMGRSTALNPDKIIFDLMALGFASTCYDGQYFFDTDHPVGDGAFNPTHSESNFTDGAGPAWYLLDTSRAIRPFIYQERKAPNFVAKDKDGDDNVFFRKEYIYGVDGRSNAGFGLWQLAYASKAPLTGANYEAARAAMSARRGDNGSPLGIVPNKLVVPTALEGDGRRLLKNTQDAYGATNTWAGSADLIVTPWL